MLRWPKSLQWLQIFVWRYSQRGLFDAVVRPAQQIHAFETLRMLDRQSAPSFRDDYYARFGVSHRLCQCSARL